MKPIKITIKQLTGCEYECSYIAYYKSEFLKSVYCCYFADNIYGSVSLVDFVEMLKSKYNQKSVQFEISTDKVSFKSQALIDMLNKRVYPAPS